MIIPSFPTLLRRPDHVVCYVLIQLKRNLGPPMLLPLSRELPILRYIFLLYELQQLRILALRPRHLD